MNSKEINKLDKIKIISEIDQLKVIANNHFLMKKYNEAIRVSEKIIQLAKAFDLKSIVKEQEELITEINSNITEKKKIADVTYDFDEIRNPFELLLSDNKIEEAHDLIEKFKHKYENIYNLYSLASVKELILKDQKLWNEFLTSQANLKRQLEPLEIELNSYLTTNNILLASETLNEAKRLLKNVKNNELLQRWETLSAMVSELHKKDDIIDEIEKAIEEASRLTDDYKFKEAKELLNSMIKITEIQNISELGKKLLAKIKVVIDAEEKYNKLYEEVKELEEILKVNLSNSLFEEALRNCEKIIKISRFIGKLNYVEMYEQFIIDIKSRITDYNRFENIKLTIKSLHFQGLESLNKGNFSDALKKYKEIREKLKNALN